MQPPPYSNQWNANNARTEQNDAIPLYPGQFGYASPPPAQPYNGIILAVLVIVYIIIWVLSFSSTAFPNNSSASLIMVSFSSSLLWLVLVSILIMDWNGYRTLDGLIKWRQMSASKKFWTFCALLFLFIIIIGIYLGRKTYIYSRRTPAGQMHTPLKSRRPAIGMIVGTIVAIIAFPIYANHTSSTAVVNRGAPYVAPTQGPTQITSKAMVVPSPISTKAPTVVPTHAPAPTQPPPAPTQPPSTGINENPWGYNFIAGTYIYNPPANFCTYFACIKNFWEADDPGDGYVVECNDSMYSQSGGERGACSYHSGVMRPLYSH